MKLHHATVMALILFAPLFAQAQDVSNRNASPIMVPVDGSPPPAFTAPAPVVLPAPTPVPVIPAPAKSVDPVAADLEKATHATTLSDAEFTALKERMKQPITKPCPITIGDGKQVEAPVPACVCLRDAFFKQVDKAGFEKYVTTHQVVLNESMKQAQAACLSDIPELKPQLPAPTRPVTSDDRYIVLQWAQAQCLRDIGQKKTVSTVDRNLCSCIATKRVAAMSDAEIFSSTKSGVPAMYKNQQLQMEAACKQ